MVEIVGSSAGLEILGEETLYEQGSFKRVRRYLAGFHPEQGIHHTGWRGDETIVERNIIRPNGIFTVVDKLSS